MSSLGASAWASVAVSGSSESELRVSGDPAWAANIDSVAEPAMQNPCSPYHPIQAFPQYSCAN